METISIHGANKQIKGKVILEDINLSLESGKIYAFIGRNGCGKTMLFRAIAGLISLNKGSIKVFGKELGKDISFPESLGLIIENVGLWNNLTAMENLVLLASIKREITKEKIRDTLERVGLEPDDKRTYKKFSLGMKQKLAIAQAIMEEPKLIILDEPTNSLDVQTVDKVRNILLEEKEKGATILLASHTTQDIEVLADQVFNMVDGRIEA